MASPYDEFCGRISSEFNREFDNQDKESRFAGLGMIKTVLPQPELDKFYNILKDEQVERPDDAQAFKQIIERRMLYEFLAAMLCAQCSFEAAMAFVDKMVLGNLAKIQEKRAEKPYYLPQSERDLETLFGNFTDARKFLSVQKLFCVIVFGSVDVVTIKTDEMKSLPWTVNKKLNSGTYGIVEEVTISSDHLTTNGDFNNVNSMTVQLARKSFVEAPNPRKNFNQELQTIRRILRSSSKSDNILTSLAAIVVEETKDTNFYLLMPLALCDLKQYMETDRQMDVKFKARLIGSAMGLANGLSFLHKNIHSDEGDHICYHLDLRPANVLLFKDQHSSYADEMVWKLSDFGISKVKTVHEPGKKPKNSGTEESRLLKDLFRTQESDSGEGVASDTKNVRGRSTFSPPEATNSKPEMNENSDIWSLGCIISVLFTYMENGHKGVTKYASARGECAKDKHDAFWKSFAIYRYEINDAVLTEHSSLIDKCSVAQKAAMEDMLGFLETDVLKINKRMRCDAKKISGRLRNTKKAYLEETSRPGSLDRTTRKSVEQSTSRSKASCSVDRWQLGKKKSDNFKGCDSSPNGSFLAYWNHQTIMVFDVSANRRELVAKNGLSDRLRASFDSFRGATTREPTFECYEKETDKPEECWCAVKLTNNYIVAISSSRKDSHCYIFKIGDGTNLSARYKKPLLRKEFHALSVCQSPDTLACLLSDATNGSILWRAKIHWENPQPDTMATGSHTDGTSSSGNNEIRLELVEEKEFPVERPDQQLEHFILDTHETCYMVFPMRRDPLALSVVLNNFELQKSVTHRLLLKNHGHTMSRMFTDMTPFYKGSSISEAFMVTHSDQIWHFKSGRTCNNLTVDGYQPTDQYRLLSITTCEETGRIFALGGYSGCTSIELLEIGLDGTDVDPELTKRAKLNGLPENSEKLHLKVIHKSGTAAVLVMAVKPTKQYVIDL